MSWAWCPYETTSPHRSHLTQRIFWDYEKAGGEELKITSEGRFKDTKWAQYVV